MYRILLALLMLLMSSAAHATTYYVSTTGSDAAAGTIGAPWLTAQKAANTMVAGDTALFNDGTYVMGELIVNGNSGTAGNPITFKAINKWQAIWSSTSGCTPGVVIFTSYTTFQDLRLAVDPTNVNCDHYTAQNAIMWATGGTNPSPTIPNTALHHLTVSGVWADSTNVTRGGNNNPVGRTGRSVGIKSNQDNTLITNSTINGSIEGFNIVNFTVTGNISYGGDAYDQEPQINCKGGCRNEVVQGNIVHANVDGGDGIIMGGNGSGYWWDSTLAEGHITGTTMTVTAIDFGDPIQVGETVSGNEDFTVISGTTIQSQLSGAAGGIGTYQVSISQTTPNPEPNGMTMSRTNVENYNGVALDNVIINETANVHGNASGMRGCNNCSFINNVFTGGEQIILQVGSEAGFVPIPQSLNPTFVNNIFDGINTPYQSGFFGFTWSGTLTMDHNNFFNYSTTPTQTNAVSGDPKFVNITSDWHLQSGSPAIAAGTTASQPAFGGGTIPVNYDAILVTRTAPWDLGIFTTAGPVLPPLGCHC